MKTTSPRVISEISNLPAPQRGSGTVEAFLFLLCCAFAFWCVSVLFLPRSGSVSERGPTLRPDILPPDISEFSNKIRDIPPAQSSSDWRAASLRPDWRYIVIHHSSTASGNAAKFDREHRSGEHPMENGMAYHFVIGNGNGSEDGLVEVGERWKKQLPGGHVA
ncbi:MAG: hypothetical protein JXR97_11105, partial [Planctomycetes bacterium]|nr:hypothetical protein [Planctomycetota bacterium]